MCNVCLLASVVLSKPRVFNCGALETVCVNLTSLGEEEAASAEALSN